MNGGIVSALPQLDVMRASYLCPNCGLPRDYEHFDESGFENFETRRSSPAVRWCWRALNCHHNTAGCSKISPSLPTCSGAISPRSKRRPAMDHLSQQTAALSLRQARAHRESVGIWQLRRRDPARRERNSRVRRPQPRASPTGPGLRLKSAGSAAGLSAGSGTTPLTAMPLHAPAILE